MQAERYKELHDEIMTAEGDENKIEALIRAVRFLLDIAQSNEKGIKTLFDDRI